MADDTGGAPIRASDAERDLAVRQMRDAAAQGRLTFEELADRVEAALREARGSAPEMHIDAGTVFGDVELLVPEGIEVEVRSRTFLGDIKQEAGEAAPPGAPRIVLPGGTVFGDVRVRARRLRERLAERLARSRNDQLRRAGRRLSAERSYISVDISRARS
jgi:hypothetical protein